MWASQTVQCHQDVEERRPSTDEHMAGVRKPGPGPEHPGEDPSCRQRVDYTRTLNEPQMNAPIGQTHQDFANPEG